MHFIYVNKLKTAYAYLFFCYVGPQQRLKVLLSEVGKSHFSLFCFVCVANAVEVTSAVKINTGVCL